VAGDQELLMRMGVTHVLNCAPYSAEEEKKLMQSLGIQYREIAMLDSPEFDMNPIIYEAVGLIDEAMKQQGVCLVHCNAGISRSTSIVISYLMLRRSMSFESAFDLVKSLYNKTRPNEGFLVQLKELCKREVSLQ